MKKATVFSSETQQFSTFLIKKSHNGKMALWFVMIFIPSLNNFVTLPPVWRKIEKNGLPKNIGSHGPYILGGNINLLGSNGAGPNEMAYIEKICRLGSVKWTIKNGTSAFENREALFEFLLSFDKQ
jgi:hypothetical protein